MNHDLIGFLIIAVGLTLVCAPFVWTERRQERARRDALLLAFLEGATEEINLDAINEGRRSLLLPTVVDMAELAAFATTADLPENMRSA